MSGFEGGIFVIANGIPRPVTATTLAQWLALGRGGPLRGDLDQGEMILRGAAMEHVWRGPLRSGELG